MRLFLFSTGDLRPIERSLRDSGSWLRRLRLPMVVALLERPDGLVLVDTGFGTDALRAPLRLPGPGFLAVAPLQLARETTALGHVERLGYRAEDVRDIVLTHLHLDHAGGIADFPNARVHTTSAEYRMAMSRRLSLSYFRYTWRHGPRWVLHDLPPERRFGFDRTLDLFGDGSVVLVATPGHTPGHQAVALNAGGAELLHCGDAFYFHEQVGAPSRIPFPQRAMHFIVGHDEGLRRETAVRLVETVRARPSMHLVCSHDAELFARLPEFPQPLVPAALGNAA